jgi:AcrR family transcriptional regulator
VGTRQARGEQTRRRLLDTALELYERAGPDGFTLTAVTEASGVSVGSLYHHFGSVDGLAAALYAECMDELLDTLLVALARAGDARAGVTALVAAYLDWSAAHRARAHVIHASAYAAFLPPHAATVTAGKALRMAAIADWLRPQVATGRILDLPPALLEMLVIGPPAETVRRWLSAAPGIDLAEARQVLPERVWRSVIGVTGDAG